MNKNVFDLTVSIGTDSCYDLLMEFDLPEILFNLYDNLANQTVELDYINKRCHTSRMRVMDSIIDLLCLFTEKEDLFMAYGEEGIDQIADRIKILGLIPKKCN